MSNLHKRIKDQFGKICLDSVRELENTGRKIADFRNHQRFNLRCLKEGITPRLPADIYNEVQDFTNRGQLAQHNKGKTRQQNKFDRLLQKNNRSRADSDPNWRSSETATSNKPDERWVKNLSSHTLSEPEKLLLSKGLNFAVTPQRIPTVDIITETESAIRRARLPHKQAEALRTKVATTLKVSKPPANNITQEEQAALKALSTNKDIIILPADKGRCTVVLDREQYDSKVQDLLSDNNTYLPLKKDPTPTFKAKITAALKELQDKKAIDRKTYLKIYPTGEQPPAFYGLPNIHKKEVPLRPIVSSVGSVTYELSRFLVDIIGPLVGKSEHHIKNSADFVNKIKDIRVEEDEIIISYDVCSLFTSIPPKRAVAVVRDFLESDTTLGERTSLSSKQICDLLELCLGCTYFVYNGQYYQQLYGCAMGSPVSPIVVNLYMERFETEALSTFADTPPANWFRLKKTNADKFFQHINQIDDNIKFT
ncbi:uncharacterized protein LOC118406009 [Branchiostoma floridae]|uniref:Uncharacterized protein LOC118406009 n=1 Tax=Branchiostoma floridae TaxID=7739 RepID=A0A9J7HQV8_BRAFL|nr:uncharacterized protein LOC118406009 [Branchiostoma floridae]